jgi:hypothetical protein
MANTKIPIYYPVSENDVEVFYDNAVKKLVDKYAAKYVIDSSEMTKILAHKSEVPLKIATAFKDKQTSKASTRSKVLELAAAKKQLLRVFNQIVIAPNFDESDAEDLGMRREKRKLDLNDVKPVIKHFTVYANKVSFSWRKGKLHGVSVELSYDGNNFAFLDKDSKSPFDDFTKNKVRNESETRYYRFRYIYNDEPVGKYTEVIKVLCDIY